MSIYKNVERGSKEPVRTHALRLLSNGLIELLCVVPRGILAS